METKHPLSAKAQFMALYWKQKVFIVVGDQFDEPLILDEVSIKFHKSGSLELRSIESLSDYEKYILSELTCDLSLNNERLKIKLNHNDFDTIESDYLRGVGVLISFTYIHPETNKPVTISPDELVSIGWATIKK